MICYKNINLKNILLVVLLIIIVLVILFNDINELSFIKNIYTFNSSVKDIKHYKSDKGDNLESKELDGNILDNDSQLTNNNYIYTLESFSDWTKDNLETHLFDRRYASIIKLLSSKKIEMNDPDEPNKKISNNALLNCFQINITLNPGKNVENIIELNTDEDGSFTDKYVSIINQINTLNNTLFVLKPGKINGNLVISNNYNPSYSGPNKFYGCHLVLKDDYNNKTLFNRFKLELIYNDLDEGKESKDSLDGLKFIFEKNNNYRLYSKKDNSDLEKDEYYHEYIKEENAYSSININSTESKFILMDDFSNYNIISSLNKIFENIAETQTDSNKNSLKYKQVNIKNIFEYIINFKPNTVKTDSETMITYDNFTISNIDNFIENTKTSFTFKTEVCDNDNGLSNYKLLYSFKQNESNNNFTTKTTYKTTDIKTFTSMRIKDIDQIILDTMTQTILPVINFDEKIIKAENELNQIKDIYKFNELSNQMTQMRFYRS